VYVYFDNDAKVRAPFDAMGLERKVRERMGQSGGEGGSHPSAARTDGAPGGVEQQIPYGDDRKKGNGKSKAVKS
jgi:hypothetical protein